MRLIQKYRVYIFIAVFIFFLIAAAFFLYLRAFYYKRGEVIAMEQIAYSSPITFEFKDKIWLHRVNSVERLLSFYDKYSGFEVDLHYNEALGTFIADHDGHDAGVTLEDLLAATASLGQRYFWFDVKNLTLTNALASRLAMDRLLEKYGLEKSTLLVESPNIQALSAFTEAGYITSFYFNGRILSSPERFAEQRWLFYASGVTAISADLKWYPAVTSAFPNVPWLFWDMKSYPSKGLLSIKHIATKIRLTQLLKDENIKVILVGRREMFR